RSRRSTTKRWCIFLYCELQNGAFGECDSLKDIYYGGSETQWSAIKIVNEDVFHVHDTAIPKKAVIHYNFKQPDSSSKPAPTEVPKFSFTDVTPNDYFADAVQWAVERDITSGTSKTTFSPDATCSKAQILAFLWRANGSPDPTAANPFTDIRTTDYFIKRLCGPLKRAWCPAPPSTQIQTAPAP
ncbi:MAG: S-layer homology domain-containing protein, partial [Lawsonibacter sp.]|nr:S-layer homology domain-containing protein [Lawsonibacter sp.]